MKLTFFSRFMFPHLWMLTFAGVVFNASVQDVNAQDSCNFGADCFDAFSVGFVLYHYPESALPSADNAVKELSRLLSVDRAAVHGTPGKFDMELLRLSVGEDARLDVQAVAAEKHGPGFIWKVVHTIRGASRSASDCCSSYTTYVNPNGSVVPAKRFLFSQKELLSESSSQSSFGTFTMCSILAFDELGSVADRPKVDGEEALKIASETIRSFCTTMAAKEKLNPRFHDQILLRIPVGELNTGIIYEEVWRVRFLFPGKEGLWDPSIFAVWVSRCGSVSRVVLDTRD